jgi:hypothetical protein
MISDTTAGYQANDGAGNTSTTRFNTIRSVASGSTTTTIYNNNTQHYKQGASTGKEV